MTARQYARLHSVWLSQYRSGDLGLTRIESTVRYLGVKVDGPVDLARLVAQYQVAAFLAIRAERSKFPIPKISSPVTA
jgi:hypothetical protein